MCYATEPERRRHAEDTARCVPDDQPWMDEQVE
jgi:hypothetical protein